MSYNMKYIKKVILENFQSHKYTEIEFDQYLNVIVGPSDHGKTAIIRALKWALFNEPSGDFFIREGEKECSVTVIFSDNTKVKRSRSKSKNAYYLYDKKGKEMIFEGFGTTVPQEIINKTSMRKIELDSSQSNSINISEQLEGPFLLSEKNATRANAIGRLVGVHIVDDALKDTLKDIRNLNMKKKSYEDVLKKLEKDLIEYDYLEDLVKKVQQIEKLKHYIYNSQLKLNKLSEILTDLNKLEKDIRLVEEYLDRLENLYKVINIEKNLNEKIRIYNYISNKYSRLDNIKIQKKYNSNLLNSLKETNRTEEIIDKINSYYDKIVSLNKINKKYMYVHHNILKNKRIYFKLKNISNAEKSIKLGERKYLRLVELLNLNYKLDCTNKSLSIGTIYIDKLSNLDLISKTQNTLKEKNKALKVIMDYKNKYDKIMIRKLNIEKNLTEIKIDIKEQLKQYKFILTKIEVCPLCFSSIDGVKIDEIVNNYK